MTAASSRKGDRAEREIAGLLADLTGWPVRRRYREGVADDCGDLDGLPDCVAQVRHWADVLEAERTAIVDVERQRAEAGVPFAVALIRHRGGRWVAAMTPEMFAALLREATTPDATEEAPEVEVRVCPLGPPRTEGRVAYAWCSECERVRKSNVHCPMVDVS